MAADDQLQSDDAQFNADLNKVDVALEQARAELAAMTDAASAADQLADENAEYSLHEVPGIGRYAVVRRTGWRALLKVIHDAAANIDFSGPQYPGFDGIIGQKFQSPYLLDPLDEKYESYRNLRDNIAAVRNFLMESYYVNTPPGMTPEKAKQAMAEIAKYIGEGLDNNYKFLGIVPNHHLGKPFISIDLASEPGGAGAQYIYDKILEMHRQSNWMRPFAAVVALFGGTAPPDWMLPPAHQTEFMDMFSRDIAPDGAAKGPSPDALKQGIANVESLEAKRQRMIDAHTLSNVAVDLNAMGDQLLGGASGLKDVGCLGEPVRRDAIEIAKDILRKLRFSLGDINVRSGLNLPPNDDASVLGGMIGVARVYERMLGWARGLDPSIMQHPSVVAANQALGQMGYIAKLEALRLAKMVGNTKLADSISEQVSKIPSAYSTLSDGKLSSLLDRIESGMNVLMTRVQNIAGPTAKIGHSAAKETGQSISQPPTAGMGQQATSTGKTPDNATARNAQMLAAEQAYLQAQMARIQQQQTVRARTEGAPPPQNRSISGRTQIQHVRTSTEKPRITTTTTAMHQPLTTRQQQNQNDALRLEQQRREQQEREELAKRMEAQRQTQLAQQKATAAKAAAQKIDPSMLKGFQSATNTKGLGPVASVKKQVPKPPAQQPSKPVQPSAKPSPSSPEEKQQQLLNTQVPPTNRGGGRGM